jgi:hypothetical protein
MADDRRHRARARRGTATGWRTGRSRRFAPGCRHTRGSQDRRRRPCSRRPCSFRSRRPDTRYRPGWSLRGGPQGTRGQRQPVNSPWRRSRDETARRRRSRWREQRWRRRRRERAEPARATREPIEPFGLHRLPMPRPSPRMLARCPPLVWRLSCTSRSMPGRRPADVPGLANKGTTPRRKTFSASRERLRAGVRAVHPARPPSLAPLDPLEQS